MALPARLYSMAEVSSLHGQPAELFTAGCTTEENIVLFGTVTGALSQGAKRQQRQANYLLSLDGYECKNSCTPFPCFF
jgi:hypothetical protein